MLMNKSSAVDATEHRVSADEITVEAGPAAQEPGTGAEVTSNVVELFPGAGRGRGYRRGRMRHLGSDAGMATAEYAIATLRAVPLGLLLPRIRRRLLVRYPFFEARGLFGHGNNLLSLPRVLSEFGFNFACVPGSLRWAHTIRTKRLR